MICKTRLSQLISTLLLGLLTAFGPVCSDIYLPALPEISDYFSCDPAVLHLSLTSCFFGIALGQFLIGPISDAYGRYLPLVGSLGVFALTSYLCAISTEIDALIVYRFLQGLSGGGGIVLSRAMACDLFTGEKLTRFMAVLMSINSSAPVVAPFVGAGLISYLPWPWLFYFMVFWGILMMVMTFLTLSETHHPTPERYQVLKALSGTLGELKNRSFLALVLSFSAINAGFFGYLAHSPFVFEVIYGFSAPAYALIFSIYSGTIAIASLLVGRLVKRYSEVQIVNYSLYLMAATSAGALAVALFKPTHPIFALVTLLIYGAMMGSAFTAGFTVVMCVRRGQVGAASGLFGVTTYLVGSAAMPLMGLMGPYSMLPLGIDLCISTVIAYILFNYGVKLALSDRSLKYLKISVFLRKTKPT